MTCILVWWGFFCVNAYIFRFLATSSILLNPVSVQQPTSQYSMLYNIMFKSLPLQNWNKTECYWCNDVAYVVASAFTWNLNYLHHAYMFNMHIKKIYNISMYNSIYNIICYLLYYIKKPHTLQALNFQSNCVTIVTPPPPPPKKPGKRFKKFFKKIFLKKKFFSTPPPPRGGGGGIKDIKLRKCILLFFWL